MRVNLKVAYEIEIETAPCAIDSIAWTRTAHVDFIAAEREPQIYQVLGTGLVAQDLERASDKAMQTTWVMLK